MANPQEDPVLWNEVQTTWRRNLLSHLRNSLEFQTLLMQAASVGVLEERYGIICTRVQDQIIVNLKEDC